eukprot:TRINITY_DN2210_c0_g1_i3.p1 TRINITY_DN2210_c0_g1~~TRINITY_DN2210_c0_g1_i3.p1  ORF type:complete len:378 (-),score=220.30 TRINITY_DN2210_c0_g1_i3:388-1455(-)
MADVPETLVLIGMGNPLLDISSEVKPELLTKYGLEPSNAILAEEKHMPLYAEMVKDYDVQYVPGGSALNTVRAANWLLGDKAHTGYFGSVGKDDNADILKHEANKEGVFTHFCVDDSKPTGTCAALITDHKRSLVANLAAAEAFKTEHVSSETAQAMLAKAKVLYVTAFFLTHSPDAAMELGKYAAEKNVPFVMNVSAPFLVQVPIFKERVLALFEYADYVFCNEHEAAALGEAMGWGADLGVVAQKTAALPKKNGARARRVIFTHGGEPAVLTGGDSPNVTRHAVVPLADGELVDENGAGDAYVGGFLAGLSLDEPIEKCFANAAYCAWTVIRRHGCALPADKEAKEVHGFSFP